MWVTKPTDSQQVWGHTLRRTQPGWPAPTAQQRDGGMSQDLAKHIDRPGQPSSFWRDDERALDENRVRGHRVEQFILARVIQTELGISRFTSANCGAHVDPGIVDHVRQLT